MTRLNTDDLRSISLHVLYYILSPNTLMYFYSIYVLEILSFFIKNYKVFTLHIY